MSKSNKNKSKNLIEEIINNKELLPNYQPHDLTELNYKTEYEITPSINEYVYKLDPMLILGIVFLTSILIYYGYKYSIDENNKNENVNIEI